MSPLFRKRREDETGSIAPKGHNSSLTRQIATFINTIDPKRARAARFCCDARSCSLQELLYLSVIL
jgi:hypothetical protein